MNAVVQKTKTVAGSLMFSGPDEDGEGGCAQAMLAAGSWLFGWTAALLLLGAFA